MKPFFVLSSILMLTPAVFGGTAFRCFGDRGSESIEAYYGGGYTNSIVVKENRTYGIRNRSGADLLTLKLNSKTKIPLSLEGYPLHYGVNQIEGMKIKTTILALPIGVLGAGIAYHFKSVLLNDEKHFLSCEIVPYVQF